MDSSTTNTEDFQQVTENLDFTTKNLDVAIKAIEGVIENSTYMERMGDLVDRHDKELRKRYAEDYRIESGEDEKGIVFLVQGKIALKAIEDKIIVLLDKFKSGYECSHCLGSGEGTACPDCHSNPGLNHRGGNCKTCEGEYTRWIGKKCPTCNGRGSTLIIPDSAKALPTSGTVVSIGPDCTKRHVGERIIFGAHVGFFLPFKGNVRLRMMRETEPLCNLFLVDTNATEVLGDFLQVDEQPDNS